MSSGMKLLKLTVMGIMVCCATVHADENDTPMDKEMKKVSKAFKSLRKIDRNDWDALAKAARTAHEAFLKSMPYTASLVKDMPEGPEKVKAIADSRRLMGLAYAGLCELELAYLEKDPAKVKAAYDKVKAWRSEGHKAYTDD